MSRPTVGVLALQGDVREHLHALGRLDVDAVGVRRPEELARCQGLVVPGGESTTMIKLARIFDLLQDVRERIAGGLPVFGTCAGMIMLADRLKDGAEGQETFGGLDATVRRNAFGRQVDSFEADLDFTIFDEPVHAVFIRAPWIEEVGPQVQVLASVGVGSAPGHDVTGAGPGAVDGTADRIVAVQQGQVLATSFHPEVDDDLRLHQHFVDIVTS